MHVIIIDSLGSPYDGSTLGKRGLGGSESAVISIARELSKLGIDVTVLCDCENLDANGGEYDGVYYNTIDGLEFDSAAYDVAISSRSVRPFLEHSINATKKIVWLHDTFCDGDELLENMVVDGTIDEVWTLSDFHTSYITNCNHGQRRMAEVLKRKIWQTRNGVNLYRQPDIQNKENYFVWNASVTKGLYPLLDKVWPLIRTAEPEARLKIIGGYYPLKTVDAQEQAYNELRQTHDGNNGVEFLGLISQSEVAEVLCHAAAMLYPQSLPETYGISTVESLAYGTPVISGRFGAMEETAVDRACYLMDYPIKSNVLFEVNEVDQLDKFVDMALSAYRDTYLRAQKSNYALIVREMCGWDTVALQWKQHLYKITDRYLPVSEYREATYINQRVREIFGRKFSNPEESTYYRETEREIAVIIPVYNAEDYIVDCLRSIEAQDYDNFEVYVIDDASTDSTVERIEEYLATEAEGHISLYKNPHRRGALANQLDHIDSVEDNTIIFLLDGDDRLVNDPTILKRINRLYHYGAKMTYGSCWSDADNIPLIAQEYPAEVHENKSYEQHKFAWNIPYTHPRTFVAELVQERNDDKLRDSTGEYYRAGGDVALFYQVINSVEPDDIRVVRDVLYRYNDLNPLNDYKVNGEEQTRNANQIMSATKRILIAIPTSKNIHAETFKSIYDLNIPAGYEVDFQYFYGYCIDQVRNLIADHTLRHGYDYLFAVDYDMSFDRDTLSMLIKADKDVVSGLYRQRRYEMVYEAYVNSDRGQVNILTPKRELQEVDAVGFGCVLVKSGVLENVGYPQFTYKHAIEMRDTVSEDINFCNAAKAKGYTIWLDGRVKCGHHGDFNYKS